MDLLPQVLVDGLTVGGTYALGAVGVSLVFGVLNIINFGQGAAYTVSAFVAMAMLTILHVPVIVAFPTGIVAALIVGWIIERVAVRPLHAQPRLMALITTMGLGLVIENLARFVFGPQTQPLSADLPSFAYQFGDTTVSIWELVTMAVVLVATFGLHIVLRHTNFGAAVRAVAEDQRAAKLLGINVNRLVVVTFCAASGLGGVAGVLAGALYNSIYPTMGSTSMLKAFAASVLGGMEQVTGAIVGGLLLGVVEAATSVYFSSAWRDAIAMLLLVVVLIVKPTGLLGKRGLDKIERTNLSVFPLPPVPKLDLRCPMLFIPVLALPFVIRDPYYLRILSIMAMYGTLALSLNLIAGFAGIVSLGQAAFYGIGAYASAILSTRVGVPVWGSMILATAIAGLAGAAFAWPIMRLRGHYISMGTLGLSGFIWMLMLNWMDLTRGPMGIRAIPPPSIFGFDLGNAGFCCLILFILGVATLVALALLDSPFGRALRAMRDDELGAQSVGIDPRLVKMKIFAISAAIAGAAGAFFAHYLSFISPDSFTPNVSIGMLAMVVLGGLGSVPGAIFGGALLAALPELLRFTSDYRDAIYGIVMVLIVLYRPQGLLGRRHVLDRPRRRAHLPVVEDAAS